MTDFLEQDATTAEARAAEAAGAGLSPLAITHEALLRELAVNGAPETLTALAEAAGVRVSNINRDLRLLDTAGLLTLQPLAVTDKGHNALAALALYRARVEGHADDPAPAPLGDLPLQGLPHAAIAPDGFNPRKAFDEDGLAELAASIALDGLLQPLVVRPPAADAPAGAPHRLVAGERRWRAIGALIADGRWPADRPVPVTLRDMDDETHLRLAIIENLQRRELKPLEEGHAFRRLQDEFGLTTAQIAEQIGFTQRFVQKRLQLLECDAADQQLLDEGRITIEEALRRLAARPTPEPFEGDELLVFLECAYRKLSTSANWWETFRVSHTIEADDTAAALKARGLLSFGLYSWSSSPGMNASLAWKAQRVLAEQTGAGAVVLADIAARLAEIRGLPAWSEQDGFATPWLNPPYSLSPEQEAEIAGEQAERERREAQRKAEAEERERKSAARKAAGESIARIALAPDLARRPETVLELTSAFGHPLPWRWVAPTEDEVGAIVDANGEEISLDSYDGEELFPLVMAAMNAMAGLPPERLERPADTAEDGDAEDGDADADDEAA